MPALGDPLIREFRRRAAEALPPQGSPIGPEGLPQAAEISRRDFLRTGLALGAGVAAASAVALPRRARASDAPRVVVVGAGLAGLTCAYRLSRHGIAPELFEAQDRLGGRCWSIRGFFLNDQTAEHGGQYVDSRHRQLRHVARELDVGLVDTFAQSFPAGSLEPFWLDGALRDPGDIFADFGVFIERLRAEYRRVGRYDWNKAGPEAYAFDRVTMTEWFDDNLPGGAGSLLGLALGVFMQSFFGLNPEDMSAINLFEAFVAPYPGADERYRVAGGNDRLAAALVEAIPDGTIRTGHALEATWSRDDGRAGLRFTGVASDVVADRVVLALPFTALRETDITGLTLSGRKRRAIETLAMGTNAKLNLQLKTSLSDLDWSGGFPSDEPHYVTWDSTYGQTDPAPRTPVITIYNGGDAGAGYPTDQAHGTAPAGIVATTLANLGRGVSGIEAAYAGRAHLDSWVDDPWVHGSYAGFGPGQYTDFWGFLGRREGRVHFAGEHTSTHSQGYLNGGVESGERAAREVKDALGF